MKKITNLFKSISALTAGAKAGSDNRRNSSAAAGASNYLSVLEEFPQQVTEGLVAALLDLLRLLFEALKYGSFSGFFSNFALVLSGAEAAEYRRLLRFIKDCYTKEEPVSQQVDHRVVPAKLLFKAFIDICGRCGHSCFQVFDNIIERELNPGLSIEAIKFSFSSFSSDENQLMSLLFAFLDGIVVLQHQQAGAPGALRAADISNVSQIVTLKIFQLLCPSRAAFVARQVLLLASVPDSMQSDYQYLLNFLFLTTKLKIVFPLYSLFRNNFVNRAHPMSPAAAGALSQEEWKRILVIDDDSYNYNPANISSATVDNMQPRLSNETMTHESVSSYSSDSDSLLAMERPEQRPITSATPRRASVGTIGIITPLERNSNSNSNSNNTSREGGNSFQTPASRRPSAIITEDLAAATQSSMITPTGRRGSAPNLSVKGLNLNDSINFTNDSTLRSSASGAKLPLGSGTGRKSIDLSSELAKIARTPTNQSRNSIAGSMPSSKSGGGSLDLSASSTTTSPKHYRYSQSFDQSSIETSANPAISKSNIIQENSRRHNETTFISSSGEGTSFMDIPTLKSDASIDLSTTRLREANQANNSSVIFNGSVSEINVLDTSKSMDIPKKVDLKETRATGQGIADKNASDVGRNTRSGPPSKPPRKSLNSSSVELLNNFNAGPTADQDASQDFSSNAYASILSESLLAPSQHSLNSSSPDAVLKENSDLSYAARRNDQKNAADDEFDVDSSGQNVEKPQLPPRWSSAAQNSNRPPTNKVEKKVKVVDIDTQGEGITESELNAVFDRFIDSAADITLDSSDEESSTDSPQRPQLAPTKSIANYLMFIKKFPTMANYLLTVTGSNTMRNSSGRPTFITREKLIDTLSPFIVEVELAREVSQSNSVDKSVLQNDDSSSLVFNDSSSMEISTISNKVTVVEDHSSNFDLGSKGDGSANKDGSAESDILNQSDAQKPVAVFDNSSFIQNIPELSESDIPSLKADSEINDSKIIPELSRANISASGLLESSVNFEESVVDGVNDPLSKSVDASVQERQNLSILSPDQPKKRNSKLVIEAAIPAPVRTAISPTAAMSPSAESVDGNEESKPRRPPRGMFSMTAVESSGEYSPAKINLDSPVHSQDKLQAKNSPMAQPQSFNANSPPPTPKRQSIPRVNKEPKETSSREQSPKRDRSPARTINMNQLSIQTSTPVSAPPPPGSPIAHSNASNLLVQTPLETQAPLNMNDLSTSQATNQSAVRRSSFKDMATSLFQMGIGRLGRSNAPPPPPTAMQQEFLVKSDDGGLTWTTAPLVPPIDENVSNNIPAPQLSEQKDDLNSNVPPNSSPLTQEMINKLLSQHAKQSTAGSGNVNSSAIPSEDIAISPKSAGSFTSQSFAAAISAADIGNRESQTANSRPLESIPQQSASSNIASLLSRKGKLSIAIKKVVAQSRFKKEDNSAEAVSRKKNTISRIRSINTLNLNNYVVGQSSVPTVDNERKHDEDSSESTVDVKKSLNLAIGEAKAVLEKSSASETKPIESDSGDSNSYDELSEQIINEKSIDELLKRSVGQDASRVALLCDVNNLVDNLKFSHSKKCNSQLEGLEAKNSFISSNWRHDSQSAITETNAFLDTLILYCNIDPNTFLDEKSSGSGINSASLLEKVRKSPVLYDSWSQIVFQGPVSEKFSRNKLVDGFLSLQPLHSSRDATKDSMLHLCYYQNHKYSPWGVTKSNLLLAMPIRNIVSVEPDVGPHGSNSDESICVTIRMFAYFREGQSPNVQDFDIDPDDEIHPENGKPLGAGFIQYPASIQRKRTMLFNGRIDKPDSPFSKDKLPTSVYSAVLESYPSKSPIIGIDEFHVKLIFTCGTRDRILWLEAFEHIL